MRSLPDPGFAGDDGSVADAVRIALAAYDTDPGGGYAQALMALQRSRVLVPVVAVLGEAEVDPQGLTHDKTSDMASVLMQGRDGRMALLAFTGTEAMKRWDAKARPVPVALTDAARAARQDEAEALLVDVAGPVPLVVQGRDLEALADGFVLARIGESHAWMARAADDDVRPEPGPC